MSMVVVSNHSAQPSQQLSSQQLTPFQRRMVTFGSVLFHIVLRHFALWAVLSRSYHSCQMS